MKARRLQELDWHFEPLAARFNLSRQRNLAVVELVYYGLLMRPHDVWIQGEILKFKNRKWTWELVSLWRCHRWAGCCLIWATFSCNVGNYYSLSSRHRDFLNSFEYSKRESSLFIVFKGLYAFVIRDFHDIWAFNVCFLQFSDCCFSWIVIVKFFSRSSSIVPAYCRSHHHS